MQQPSLHGATVVITGAASGIGRATALTFARHGARLVLAARRVEVVAECEQLGALALAVPTDVTEAPAVQRLAEAAIWLHLISHKQVISAPPAATFTAS